MTYRKSRGDCWLRSVAFLIAFALVQTGAEAQSASGTITTAAGWDEGCSALAADPAGSLYVLNNHGVQKLNSKTGRFTTVSPSRVSGAAIGVDAAGNIYLAQSRYGPLGFTVQKLAAGGGAMITFAGTKEKYMGSGRRMPGPASQAFLLNPDVLALDTTGNLYIGEQDSYNQPNDVFKMTNSTGVITQVPLSVFPTKRGDPVDPIARSVRTVQPGALAFDSDGNLYIADYSTNVVWEVAPEGGLLKRVAGSGRGSGEGYGGDGGPAVNAKLEGPAGLAFDAAGNLYISDEGNNRIRMVAKGSRVITTVAGNGTSRKLTVDVSGPDGNLHPQYQKVDDGDGGPATQARITTPHSISFDGSGNLYICASGILRKVSGIGSATQPSPTH
jgi:hypothetical protein